MLSRAYGDSAPDPPRASYKHLRDPTFDKLRVPESIPKGPLSREEFNRCTDVYLRQFLDENKGHLFKTNTRKEKKENETRRTHKQRQINQVQASTKVQATESKPFKRCHFNEGMILALHSLERSLVSKPLYPTQKSVQVQDQKGDEDVNMKVFHPFMTSDQFHAEQMKVPALKQLIQLMERGTDKVDPEYSLGPNHVLLKQRNLSSGVKRFCIVVPQHLRQRILEHYHGVQAGPHLGPKRMEAELKANFYWPKIHQDVQSFCQRCKICNFEMPNTTPHLKLYKDPDNLPRKPNEVVSCDIVGPFPRAKDGSLYILTIQCEFSKFALAVPLPTKKPEGIAKALMKNWFSIFGLPKVIRSDEGTDVDATIINYLCNSFGIIKARTPAYAPWANPVERFHQTLNQMIRTFLIGSSPTLWSAFIPYVTYTYNNTVTPVTGFRPAEIFLGTSKRQDLVPIYPETKDKLDTKFVRDLEAVKNAYDKIVRRRLQEAMQKRNQLYDGKRSHNFRVGQRVLIRKFARENKLAQRWEGPFVIVNARPNSLTCIRWIDAVHVAKQFRLHHHAANLGQIERRQVHPTNVKLYKGPVQYEFSEDDFPDLPEDFDWPGGYKPFKGYPPRKPTSTKGTSTTSGGPPPPQQPLQRQRQRRQAPPLFPRVPFTFTTPKPQVKRPIPRFVTPQRQAPRIPRMKLSPTSPLPSPHAWITPPGSPVVIPPIPPQRPTYKIPIYGEPTRKGYRRQSLMPKVRDWALQPQSVAEIDDLDRRVTERMLLLANPAFDIPARGSQATEQRLRDLIDHDVDPNDSIEAQFNLQTHHNARCTSDEELASEIVTRAFKPIIQELSKPAQDEQERLKNAHELKYVQQKSVELFKQFERCLQMYEEAQQHLDASQLPPRPTLDPSTFEFPDLSSKRDAAQKANKRQYIEARLKPSIKKAIKDTKRYEAQLQATLDEQRLQHQQQQAHQKAQQPTTPQQMNQPSDSFQKPRQTGGTTYQPFSPQSPSYPPPGSQMAWKQHQQREFEAAQMRKSTKTKRTPPRTQQPKQMTEQQFEERQKKKSTITPRTPPQSTQARTETPQYTKEFEEAQKMKSTKTARTPPTKRTSTESIHGTESETLPK